LREVFADEDAHTFAIVVLGVADDGSKNFLAQQDGTDDGQNVGSFAPLEPFGYHQCIDSIDGAVEHHGIDLCDE